MPFAKRLVEPQLLCRHQIPNEDGLVYEDLVSISNVALSRTLRQLSDLAKHACSIFQELENDLASTNQRVRRLHGKINLLQQTCAELDPKQEAVPVSNLDVESKLTTHYQAPWHQQRNVFHPNTRPECIVELHRHANSSLWALHREHQLRRADSRERRVTISISALPPMPLYPSPNIAKKHEKRRSNLTTFDSTRSSSPTECCRFSPWSRKATPLDPDTDGVALGHRSKCPIPNIPTTLDKQTNWTKALPLPTPEERMKTNSQVITSCVIPINVTGVGFDRDASVRCSLVHSQSVLQRRRKLRRRRTVAGIPRQVQRELDSDDSPGSRERTVIIHASADITPSTEELSSHLNTRDSGCQTEDFLVSGAPSWRRIRAQRGQALSLSYSAGNISSLRDSTDNMFAGSMTAHLRTRSLPRDPSHLLDNGHHDSDEELSPFEAEDFLSGAGELRLNNEGGSSDPQSLSGLKYKQLSDSPEQSWMDRAHSQLPRKSDMGSCEISSSSDTFSSPVHSVSAAAVLGGQMDHKDEHQSSSGNWSGSSSTCPSQTSETMPPAASPPLTGSSHCDSELSLNAATHHSEDHLLDHYQGLRTQRAGSFSSTAMDILEEAGIGTPVGSEWGYPQADLPCPQDFSPEPNRESSLDCPSYTSMATCESSFSDKPLSEKADTVSHYSVDTEGYYTSMHFDCGLKGSKSFTYNNYAASDCSISDVSGHMTLGRRCLSLRKKKAKPCPPQRSSSLRKIYSEGNLPEQSEPKISCGQQLPLSSKERRLQLALSSSSGHIDNSSLSREPLEVWDSSSDLPDLGVFSSTDAHSFKDEGVVQTEYADLWLLNDLKSNDPYRSLSNSSTATGTTVIECMKSQEGSESQTSQSGSRATTPSLPSVEGDFKLTSPEKLVGLASPSSGYSSQSETPTSSIPSAFFPGPMSPANRKRKPKVPERKSSLTSLSYKHAASKKDLELPAIPPSHLDLGALHNNNKAAVYRTQMLHQNKHKLSGKLVAPPKGEVYDVHPIAITPSVLHSVQLKSIYKEHEGSLDDNTSDSALVEPTMNFTSTLSTSTELSSSHLSISEASPKQSCESVFTLNEELTDMCEVQSQDKEVSSSVESMTALSFHSEPSPEQTEAEINRESEADVSSGDCSLESECFTAKRLEILEDEDLENSTADKELPGCDQSELSESSPLSSEESKEVEDPESSGVSAESGSPCSKDEDYCSKDSTPSDASVSPLSDESRPEDDSVFLSPTKTRTTEDLFAMIHRSKRKVLGRKDSTELSVRNRLSAASGSTSPSSNSTSSSSPSSAVSPPPAVTPPTGLHRVPVPIYRNAKKSSTSNEEFKLLLLKKGSRSDSSYRMSATEILKSPITPKSTADSLLDSPKPFEEPTSPLQQYQSGPEQHMSSPYPRANSEGFSPKSFSTSAASRQGRSRIPPPASSSRYGMRRLYSAPMQAISEGETENSDSSPHDDRSS